MTDWKRKTQKQTAHRRRAADVVMWQEHDELVVYDSVKDECRRFDAREEAQEALDYFNRTKAANEAQDGAA